MFAIGKFATLDFSTKVAGLIGVVVIVVVAISIIWGNNSLMHCFIGLC